MELQLLVSMSTVTLCFTKDFLRNLAKSILSTDIEKVSEHFSKFSSKCGYNAHIALWFALYGLFKGLTPLLAIFGHFGPFLAIFGPFFENFSKNFFHLFFISSKTKNFQKRSNTYIHSNYTYIHSNF